MGPSSRRISSPSAPRSTKRWTRTRGLTSRADLRIRRPPPRDDRRDLLRGGGDRRPPHALGAPLPELGLRRVRALWPPLGGLDVARLPLRHQRLLGEVRPALRGSLDAALLQGDRVLGR